jgi:glyoxylase-like metal-dependent hydrolase (beta-lactamase superfamily II)
MVNYIYLIGDRETGQAVAVDLAYGVQDILGILAADGMDLEGVLVTHHHADHVGGSMMGWAIEGLAELYETNPVPVHAQRQEVDLVRISSGLSVGDIVAHDSGDVVEVGGIPVTLLHTPGHTPGSQCFMVDKLLISGDTLFLEGCGRTDLPGSDPAAMYRSLRYLASLPDDTAVFPGHRYSPSSVASLQAVRETNVVMKPASEAQWLAMFSP